MNLNLNRFSDCRILVIGDLMLDEYLWGDVDRISPEAPVPIVSVNREDFRLGGAGNVINNLVDLGARVYASGIAGAGRSGDILVDRLVKSGVNTDGIVRVDDRPTIRKTRIIAANQQVLRIDREKIGPIPDRFMPPIHAYIKKQIPEVDVVIVSDYGKGLITDALMETITLLSRHHRKISIADPKGIDFTKYAGVYLITPNKKEAGIAAGVMVKDDESILRAGRRLLGTVRSEAVLITCGKDGMILMRKDSPPLKIKARAKQVFDVSGAGDTVIAVMGLAVASGAAFEEAAQIANIAAGVVVGKIGTATVSRDELEAELEMHRPK